MISAKEANDIVKEVTEKELNTEKNKAILSFFEKQIRLAANIGNRSTSFIDDRIVDENDKRVYCGSFYSGMNVIKDYMYKLGYSMRCSDHGHIEISW